MPLTRKRILITGGAGFLGSHLCERLLNDLNDVPEFRLMHPQSS
jgi:UDP-glucuronate decarboxylase